MVGADRRRRGRLRERLAAARATSRSEGSIRHIGVHFFSRIVTILTGQRITDPPAATAPRGPTCCASSCWSQDQFWTSEILIEALRHRARDHRGADHDPGPRRRQVEEAEVVALRLELLQGHHPDLAALGPRPTQNRLRDAWMSRATPRSRRNFFQSLLFVLSVMSVTIWSTPRASSAQAHQAGAFVDRPQREGDERARASSRSPRSRGTRPASTARPAGSWRSRS